MLKLYTTIRFEQTIIATIMTRENHNFSSKMNPILWERKQVRGSKTQMKNIFFFLIKIKLAQCWNILTTPGKEKVQIILPNCQTENQNRIK